MENDVWIALAFQTLAEAFDRAYEVTGRTDITFAGDFGQDEGRGEAGIGNEDFSIIVFPNGAAILYVRRRDNAAFFERIQREQEEKHKRGS